MISVIIINHNTPEVTLRCLEHLYKSRSVEFETILINNTPENKLEFPKVKVVNNPKRLGFGANNNKGMKLAKGERILLLNSDCYVEPNTLAVLSAQCTVHKWDVVGCRLTTADGKTLPSVGYFPTLRRVLQMMTFVDNLPIIRKFIDTIHVRDTARLAKTRKVDWVQGAFMMLSREVYRKVEGFDENFHMYGEEIEWQYRIQNAGFNVWYYPQTSSVHLERMSHKSLEPSFIGEMKGYLYYFKKHRPVWEQILLPWVLLFGCLIRIPAWAVWGRWELTRAYWSMLPVLWRLVVGSVR